MHPFPIGTQVQTNEEYFRTFGRRVIGEVISANPPPPNEITIVKWVYQEGNSIPQHQNNAVLMMTKDLEAYLIH